MGCIAYRIEAARSLAFGYLTHSSNIWNGVDMTTPFSVFEWLLDVVYPPVCLGCNEMGEWICNACLCGIPFVVDDDPVLSLGYYGHPLLRVLLTRFKYASATCLLPSLRLLLERFRYERQKPWPWAREEYLFLCSIPSDQDRVRARGTDHARCLEELVFREFVPWAQRSNVLRRKIRVRQNASLPHNELRSVNVRGVFEVIGSIKGAVLLVDDVYTTGATWNEAARVLKAAGAERVYGFVFAKG